MSLISPLKDILKEFYGCESHIALFIVIFMLLGQLFLSLEGPDDLTPVGNLCVVAALINAVLLFVIILSRTFAEVSLRRDAP